MNPRALIPVLLLALLPPGAAAMQQAGGGRGAGSATKAGAPASAPAAGRTAVAKKAPATPVAPLDQLSAQLKAAIGRTGGVGRWGVLVVSMSRGETLFTRNADDRLLPASTMKLFTSAVALERFGTDGRFRTEVLRVGALGTDSVLRGDLVLRGAGDPTLSAAPHDLLGEPAMQALARQVAEAGVRRVSGAIVGDASAYDDPRVPDGWRTRYLRRSYAARVSALSFNENMIAVHVRPAGGAAEVSFFPPMSGIPVRNLVKVVRGSRSARVRVREDSLGRLELTGWIGALSRSRRYTTVVETPETFAAGALHAALAARGVVVEGAVRPGRAPDDATVLASLDSPPLARMVDQMNGESNNHYAELLFRNAARDVGVAGSAENANTLLQRFLVEKLSALPTAVFAADGSGLSTLDRVTPRTLVQLLSYARQAPWGTVFEKSLPVAGVSETLRRRMRNTRARGNLRAKTGTTAEVASLSGYVTARNGEELAFAFIYNGGNQWRAKSVIDLMGARLASFAR